MATRSPGQWLDVLEPQLDNRWLTEMGVYDAYFEGDHRLAFATSQFREAFGTLFSAIADNWCQQIVQAPAERLTVQGFRLGKATSADDEAWAIWQANSLDGQSNMLHTESIKLGEAYWLVAPPATPSDPPLITAEHPCEVIVARSRANRRERIAALKKFVDDDGYAYAIVYTPEWIAWYQSADKMGRPGSKTGNRINWRPVEAKSGPNPLGKVPIVDVCNMPAMLTGGTSDLKVGIPIQDAINKVLSDMLIGSEYQAFPQRVLMGVEVPRDENGQPIRTAVLQASKSRVWFFDDPAAKATQFDAASLSNYVGTREHLIKNLSAKTRIPPHYLLGEMVNISGDAMKAAESGLTAKTKDKWPYFSDGHEDMFRLAFLAQGDKKKAAITDSEVIWGDPEYRTEGELTDAMLKQQSLGVPQEILWERLGYSPQQIARMKAMRLTDQLLNPEPLPQNVRETIDVRPGGNQPAPTTSQDQPAPAAA